MYSFTLSTVYIYIYIYIYIILLLKRTAGLNKLIITLVEDRNKSKYGHKRETHETYNTGLTLLPPPGRHVPRRSSTTGGGCSGSVLRTDMDRLTGWGPPGRNTQKEAMAEMGVLEAMAGGPLGPANPAGVLLSPQKIHGVV